MTELENRDASNLKTLTTVRSIDSYDDVDDANLSFDERREKEIYFKSIFTQVGRLFINIF